MSTSRQAQGCCSRATDFAGALHPLDPLSADEITASTGIISSLISKDGRHVKFNSVSLLEPIKAEYIAFRDGDGPRPARRSISVVIARETHQVSEVTVNLDTSQIELWRDLQDVMPILTLEDLDVIERIARVDPLVIETCRAIGITDMSMVFFDGWAIGVDERWGFERRLQQALPYYRTSPSDNQYAHPLDFTVVADTEREEILSVDIRLVNGERTAIPLVEHNYLPEFIGAQFNYNRLKPIEITQPFGVSFRMVGNEIEWAGLKMHIGFNYREGIVLSDVRMDDPYEGRTRKLFSRISMVEMFVPYGSPETPHHKKHAFDIGEYGAGYMTNSLRLECDCKGSIQYLDAVMAGSKGEPMVIENAVCIHEEDNGILYKHTDFRDNRVVTARDRKLVISQILTAANYEYAFYHTFTLDGTYKLEVKLTGMLNTYCLHPTEQAAPYGTEVAQGIDAHNHQHIFSLRVDPEIDGPNNSVVQGDAVRSPHPPGSSENPYGNAFLAKKTLLRTAKEGATVYCHETSRTWDIVNPNRIGKWSKKPVGYKIVNNSCPALLASSGSIFAKRGAFAEKSLWVLPYSEIERFPAGTYVCQTSGEPHLDNETIAEWVARDGPIENTDIVCYIQFGITHFPRTEDFPIMPAEPVSVMIRASNFFEKNPALWVPPSEKIVDASSKLVNAEGQTVSTDEVEMQRPRL